jgi:hypothetical protein
MWFHLWLKSRNARWLGKRLRTKKWLKIAKLLIQESHFSFNFKTEYRRGASLSDLINSLSIEDMFAGLQAINFICTLGLVATFDLFPVQPEGHELKIVPCLGLCPKSGLTILIQRRLGSDGVKNSWTLECIDIDLSFWGENGPSLYGGSGGTPNKEECPHHEEYSNELNRSAVQARSSWKQGRDA